LRGFSLSIPLCGGRADGIEFRRDVFFLFCKKEARAAETGSLPGYGAFMENYLSHAGHNVTHIVRKPAIRTNRAAAGSIHALTLARSDVWYVRPGGDSPRPALRRFAGN
jgi:hypothetical protein